MPIQPLFGTNRTLPADGDTNWGEDVRLILQEMMEALDSMATIVSDVPFLFLKTHADPVTAGATITPTKNRHDLTAASAVTLGALSTSVIADGSLDGQTLLLVGTHDTNTVRIDSDFQNVVMNGDIILAKNDAIFFVWDSDNDKDSGAWVEVSRNN